MRVQQSDPEFLVIRAGVQRHLEVLRAIIEVGRTRVDVLSVSG